MADTKISALTALTGADVDTAADVLPIVDTSVTTTKKIKVDELAIATRATQAEMEAGSSANTTVAPSVQHFHPSAAKAWVHFTQSGTTVTVRKSYNVDGVVRNSAGDYTITFTTDFSDTYYTWSVNFVSDRANISSVTRAAGTFNFAILRVNDLTAQEVSEASAVFFGDHA